jgi:hypothetical protein
VVRWRAFTGSCAARPTDMLNAINREQPQAAHRGPATAFFPCCRAKPIIHTAF